MTQEKLQEMLEAIGKGGITVNGDLVLSKQVENEIGNVEAGGIGIQHVYARQEPEPVMPKGEGDDSEAGPVLDLLDMLVKAAMVQHPESPKHILLPVRAAKDAEVLPMADLAWVNARYGLKLNKTNWSTWVAKEDSRYDPRELNPLLSRFRALKTPE